MIVPAWRMSRLLRETQQPRRPERAKRSEGARLVSWRQTISFSLTKQPRASALRARRETAWASVA
jgi:hypothetical protein